MTFDELLDLTREMKAADAASVKLVVFHSSGDLSNVLGQLPATTLASSLPQMIIFPQLVPEGSALCVGDQAVVDAILSVYSSIISNQGGT